MSGARDKQTKKDEETKRQRERRGAKEEHHVDKRTRQRLLQHHSLALQLVVANYQDGALALGVAERQIPDLSRGRVRRAVALRQRPLQLDASPLRHGTGPVSPEQAYYGEHSREIQKVRMKYLVLLWYGK